MELLMCVSCGEFVQAVGANDSQESDGPAYSLEPAVSSCPACGGTSFKHTDSGTTVDL